MLVLVKHVARKWCSEVLKQFSIENKKMFLLNKCGIRKTEVFFPPFLLYQFLNKMTLFPFNHCLTFLEVHPVMQWLSTFFSWRIKSNSKARLKLGKFGKKHCGKKLKCELYSSFSLKNKHNYQNLFKLLIKALRLKNIKFWNL